MKRSFHRALDEAAAPLIAEIKPSSPKVGALLATRTVDQIARDYARAGAPCLSVTTGRWHQGSLEMIAQMQGAGLPILRKDFITSTAALEASRDAGASAVLLTCKLIRRRDLLRLAEQALSRGLTPFVEAATPEELDGLRLPEGAVLAVNNRDIAIRETDDGGVENSQALYDAARAAHAGSLISASGLLTPDCVHAARQTGFDGVLVGTALLSGPQPAFETTRDFIAAAKYKTQKKRHSREHTQTSTAGGRRNHRDIQHV
ncbi:hypothetical protein [uncultured Roseobacter sp.]|uniref:hypothetical protein n=1 Tax=uncultured Roseobacter sp. TaxID=114847 RepID=UPI002603AB0F|nr:hypothetical protein [uncultured Roseobacter sp.]